MIPATFVRACLVSALLIPVSGCMTAPQPVTGRTAYIRLVSGHSAIVQGSRTLPSRAGAALKAAGARPGTNIEISLAGNSGPGAVKTVCRSVTRAGYRNVLVVVDVKVSGHGVISVLGKDLQVSELAPRLTAMGAGRNTIVRVTFERDVSPETIRTVMQSLVRAGFPKIVTARKMAPTISVQTKE